MRDSGFDDYASRLLDWEREVHIANNSKDQLQQIDLTKLSIELKRITPDTADEKLSQLLGQAEAILVATEGRDIAPPLNCMALVIRMLRSRGVNISEDTTKTFRDGLGRVGRETKAMLLDVINETPTSSDLKNALERAGGSQFWDDLSHEAMPLRSLASTAVATATRQKDGDLWVLAASVLSQPALTARATDGGGRGSPTAAALRRYVFERASSPSEPLERVSEAMREVRIAESQRERSFASITDISVAAIAEVVSKEEAVLALAHDVNGAFTRS